MANIEGYFDKIASMTKKYYSPSDDDDDRYMEQVKNYESIYSTKKKIYETYNKNKYEIEEVNPWKTTDSNFPWKKPNPPEPQTKEEREKAEKTRQEILKRIAEAEAKRKEIERLKAEEEAKRAAEAERLRLEAEENKRKEEARFLDLVDRTNLAPSRKL